MKSHVETRLIPVTKWPDNHEWPSVGGLRHLIFNAKDNGFDAVVRRIGRRVLIDEAAFFEWAARDVETISVPTKKKSKEGAKDNGR